MDRCRQSELDDRPPDAHGDGARAVPWIDEPLLDHHIEELLEALRDLDRPRLDAGSETY